MVFRALSTLSLISLESLMDLHRLIGMFDTFNVLTLQYAD